MRQELAFPALVGGLVAGESAEVRWALWPFEVYASGCLVRVRLAPVGKWREYPDPRNLVATVQQFDGLEDERIVLFAESGELVPYASILPAQGVESRGYAPWDHAWTVEHWWPRENWSGQHLLLTWPARHLSLELPVSLALLTVASDERARMARNHASPQLFAE